MIKSTKPRDYSNLWSRPGYLIRRLHQIQVAMFLEECNEFNLTPVQFGVLTVLYDKEALDQVTIANQLGVDRNTAADVIRRLERRGLLERPASLIDKRAKLARINDSGRELVDAVHPHMVSAQKNFTRILTDKEYSQLMQLMSKIILDNNDASRSTWKLNKEEEKPLTKDRLK
jgi:MarR family transcriptional regulator, lower aerobic nicotinate degradation pathway regulator